MAELDLLKKSTKRRTSLLRSKHSSHASSSYLPYVASRTEIGADDLTRTLQLQHQKKYLMVHFSFSSPPAPVIQKTATHPRSICILCDHSFILGMTNQMLLKRQIFWKYWLREIENTCIPKNIRIQN